MKVKELKEELAKYPDEMETRIKIWKNGRIHSPGITIFQPEERNIGIVSPSLENPEILEIEICITELERELMEGVKSEG